MGKLVNGIIAAIATLFIMAGISMPALAATDDTYVPKNDSAGNIFVQDQANVLSAETATARPAATRLYNPARPVTS